MEVAIMDGILEKFMRDAAQNPERPMYDFMDCGSEPYVHHYITIGEAWQHAMDMAAELRQKGAVPVTALLSFPCRMPEPSMLFGAV